MNEADPNYLAGLIVGIKEHLERQDEQHARDKAEAITARDAKHAENVIRFNALDQKTGETHTIAIDNKRWIDESGRPGLIDLHGRLTTLEKAQALARDKAKWSAKAWAKVVAVASAIGGMLVGVIEYWKDAMDFIKGVHGEVKPQHAAGAAGIVIALIVGFEGIRYAAYKPTPSDVWTLCRGHTEGVHQGDVATPEQCDKWTEAEALKALAVVDANLTVKLTDGQRGALADFVYNEGPQAFKTSTMLKKFNAGDTTGGCIDLIDWRKQKDLGGNLVTLDGLVERRKAELKYCLGAK